jgi:chemotaxis-related protein WspB
MLFLLIHLGSGCYALDTDQVVEILPQVNIRKMLRSPPGVAGTINYRGVLVPVIDLSELALGRPAVQRLSTRIILARCPAADGTPKLSGKLLGLIAEQATETMRCKPGDFVAPGIVNDSAPYLGPIATGPRGSVQQIELSKLMPASVGDALLEQAV